jgi:hypothetical protein
MAGFNQMGGLPTGYSDLLNSARQQLVKQPDGTYTVAPQFGGSTNINDLYQGIYPPALSSPPLVSRPVNTVPIDPMTGNPVGFTPPSMASTQAEQRSGARPAYTAGTQPAGTVTMPPGARPASVPLPTPPLTPPKNDPFGTYIANQDQSRLPRGMAGQDSAGWLSSYITGRPPQGSQNNPALNAIDQLTGSGRNTARPFPLMGFNRPTYREPIDITVRGGNTAQAPGPRYQPGMRGRGQPPSVPMPRNAPPPQAPRVPDHRAMTARGLTPLQSMMLARQTNNHWAYGAGGTPDTKAETLEQTIRRLGYNPFLQNVGDHGAGSSDVAKEF